MKPQIMTVSKQAKQTLEVGRENHWWFRVVGVGEVPEPVYTDEWWLIPTDDSSLPGFARKRIEAVKSAGIPIKEIVVAHEAPKQLCAPKAKPTPKPKPAAQPAPMQPAPVKKEWDWTTIITALAVAGVVLSVAMQATGVLILFGLTTIVDPAVIVVLEDGTQIEVVRWYE